VREVRRTSKAGSDAVDQSLERISRGSVPEMWRTVCAEDAEAVWEMTREIKRIVKRFTILRGWRIGYDPKHAYKRGVTVWPKSKRAVIYAWGGTRIFPKPPEDYVLHEVLHCALRAFGRLDNRKPKEKRHAEEELVRNLCSIIMDGKK
jgi:hypothetical protein